MLLSPFDESHAFKANFLAAAKEDRNVTNATMTAPEKLWKIACWNDMPVTFNQIN